MIDCFETKAHPITKKMVLDAYKEIKANGNAAGVDGVSLDEYAKNLQRNLYKLWNRLTSGSYFPLPVREKLITKGNIGYRGLGISRVDDRIAQQVVKTFLEPKVEASFHANSFGFRRGRSQHQAIQRAMEKCWQYGWAIDLDISNYFRTMLDLPMLGNETWIRLKARKFYCRNNDCNAKVFAERFGIHFKKGKRMTEEVHEKISKVALLIASIN